MTWTSTGLHEILCYIYLQYKPAIFFISPTFAYDNSVSNPTEICIQQLSRFRKEQTRVR